MKQLLIIIMLFILSFWLMGCNHNTYTQEEIDELKSQIDVLDIETLQHDMRVLYSTIAVLEDIIFENERRLNELQEQYSHDILYGTFVGLNAYVGIVTYHVILIDGVEYETLGDSNYTFVMNEPCMVIVIGNTYHSIPLREER